jgi:protein TonB
MQPLASYSRLSLVCALTFLLPAAALRADDKSEPPVPVRTVAPEVPVSFSRLGSPGLVTVSFTVDDKGNVVDEKIVKSSNPDLDEPALRAIRKWRFKPARKDGTPVASHVAMPMKFNVE